MKELLRRFLILLTTPIRRSYRKRNGAGTLPSDRELPNDVLLGLAREMIGKGHSAIVTVKGYSMRPFLEHQRDKVVLTPFEELHIGDAILAEIDPGHYVLHRIIEMDGDELTLMGDGNVRGTEHCTRKDVAGLVSEYIRPNRRIPASDKRLQRRIRLWRRLLPIRRYLLFVYKTII